MNIDMHLMSDIIGVVGVALVVLSFFLLQTEKITPNSSIYLYSNLAGAMMLLFSLYYHWNLASVIIEVMWLFISIYGIIRVKFLKKK